jgi:hypothetical protein
LTGSKQNRDDQEEGILMRLSIKHPEAGRSGLPNLEEELLAISDRCARLPDFDTRPPDEIIGYDEHGVPR